MKSIITTGIFILLSVFTFGQIQKQNMLQEIKCTPPQFTGIKKVVPEKSNFQTIDDYLRKNVTYPTEDAEDCIQGTEVVRFIVTPSGNVTDFMVVNSVSNNIDNMVIRTLRNTNGMWKPGTNDDKPEAMEKEVTLVFKLGELSNFEFNYLAKKYYAKGNEMFFTKSSPRKALKYFDKGIVLLPNDKALLVQRGLARYQIGNKDGALRDWNRVKTLGGFESKEYLENIGNLKGYAELNRILGN